MMLEWITASSSPSASMVSTDFACGSRVIFKSACGVNSMSSSSSAKYSTDLCGTPYSCSRMTRTQWPAEDPEGLDADLAADQVVRLLDPLGRVDEHEAVAEAAMQEYRQRGDRLPLVLGHHLGGGGGLGRVGVEVA